VDIAAIAGLDDPADGRAFAILDYDRDGWPDVAVMNANTPALRLYRNQIGDHAPGGAATQMLALRFVGGNHTAQPTRAWSTRDGYGVRVTVDLGDLTIHREHRAGEDLAAQNSATMLIGIGTHPVATQVTVRWPSGRVQQVAEVPAQTLLTVYENPAHAPTSTGVVAQPYRQPAGPPAGLRQAAGEAPPVWRQLARREDAARPATLRLYTTMATWCVACREELPALHHLRATFAPADLALVGVPIDARDGPDHLQTWLAVHRPPYDLLREVTAEHRAAITAWVVATLKRDGVPATMVTDSAGQVLLTQWGLPSVSKLRELLWGVRRDQAP